MAIKYMPCFECGEVYNKGKLIFWCGQYYCTDCLVRK
jgi:late competence protein required for DNA uptake (superfamily II DNA/RNA helicase)